MAKAAATRRPAVQMLPYQQRWMQDILGGVVRFLIGLKARQIGWSFATAAAIVLSSLARPEKWYWLSAGERQAKAAMQDVAMHARAAGKAVEVLEDEYRIEDRAWRQLEVKLPGGSTIYGLPANPDTCRGVHGNVVLDEFAFHQNPVAIWRALFPVISRGYRVIVLSTPNGKQGKFYELWTHGKRFARHECDIHRAVAEGLDMNVDELREGLNDDDGWLQEFECKFLDGSQNWLSYDLIDDAEHPDASMQMLDMSGVRGPLYLGIDIGRTRDLTVLWLLEELGATLWTRAVIELPKTRFREQLDVMHHLLALEPRIVRACIDQGGMGLPLCEELQERWGADRVEGVQFHRHVKEDLATHVKAAFEERLIRIPQDIEVRRDLHKVKRIVTSAGNIRFDADRDENGHADRFWALALAQHAASTPAVALDYERVSANMFDAGHDDDDESAFFQRGVW